MPNCQHKQALDKITNVLNQLQTSGNFSARMMTDYDNLNIEIKNFGQLKLPIKPAKAKALIKYAKPAKYGLKDKTILDPKVRNVWEIPKSHIKIDKRHWNKTLNPTLLELKKELGLQENQQLKAQLHNFLIYEKGQYFHSHQDTEKEENMIATLVILLPSSYRGGTLLVENQGDSKRYPSTSAPDNKLTFIAFYADCQHEVKPVTDGYRVALTYNLSLKQDINTSLLTITNQAQHSLDKAVSDYFQKPRQAHSYRASSCNKLIYLLDHEYTPKGLKWENLKAKDQIRAQALLQTASYNELEIFLTLADIHECWDCEMSYSENYSPRYGDWYEDYEEEDDGDESEDESVDLLELLVDETEIRHWRDETGKKINYPTLPVLDDSICWTKANNECKPFEKEYEGYMGNWGDTMDYWYHRAAIVMWQKVDHYNALLEFNPAKVVEELLAQINVLTKSQFEKCVKNLLKDWSGLHREAKSADYNRVLRLASEIKDARLAYELLEELNHKALTVSSIPYLISLEIIYGAKWCIDVLKHWHTDHSYQERVIAIEALDKLVSRLSIAKSGPHSELTNWMMNHQWQVIQKSDKIQLDAFQRAELSEQAVQRFKVIKELIKTTQTALNQSIHNELIHYLLAHKSLYPSIGLVNFLLSFKLVYQQKELVHWFYQDALQQLYELLYSELQKGTRQPGDWSIMDSNHCACNDCQALNLFLQAKNTQEKIWPLNGNRRMHIHRIIDEMKLPVTHQTKRSGRPYQLVLKKTNQLFSQDKERFKQITKSVNQLIASGYVKSIK